MNNPFFSVAQQIADKKKAAIKEFAEGQRVQASPATDAWMMGDRYGVVTKVGRATVTVKMDKSGRSLRFGVDYLTSL